MLGVVKQVKQNLSTAETNRTVLSSIKAMGSVFNYFKETDVTEAAKDELHEVSEKLSKFGVVKQYKNGFTFVDVDKEIWVLCPTLFCRRVSWGPHLRHG